MPTTFENWLQTHPKKDEPDTEQDCRAADQVEEEPAPYQDSRIAEMDWRIAQAAKN